MNERIENVTPNNLLQKIIPALTAIIPLTFIFVIIFAATGNSYTTANKEASVVCNTGFFYDPQVGYTEESVTEAEKLAKAMCEDFSDRTETDITKHAVYIDEACIINWELTPEAHLKAFRHHCL